MIPLYALGDDARGYKMAVRHLKFQSINHPILPNRSIIPKNDVKNTKLGSFRQSPGRNLDFQQNFKIRGKSQKPSCTTDTKQENTVGA